ncbi:MAG TPA: SufE family protein [Anaerolineales bacterium]|nr:SufE family protein [Anaerolineales bacterium]
MNPYPERLAEIIEEFEWCEGREKLELLLDYSEKLPPLPDRLKEQHDAMQQVHECMTPVFVAAECSEDRMKFYFDVPPESPTVRGFASLLAEGLEGVSPEAILKIPNDFYLQMGFQSVLTGQRMNGLGAIFAQIKRLAVQALDGNP